MAATMRADTAKKQRGKATTGNMRKGNLQVPAEAAAMGSVETGILRGQGSGSAAPAMREVVTIEGFAGHSRRRGHSGKGVDDA